MSFLVIIISITVMGFTSVTSSQERIIDEIGGNYAEALHVTIVNIDDKFKDDVFGLLSSSDRSFVADFIINSNAQSDVSVETNELSLKLQETSNFLESKFGYPVYEDVSVADSAGTVIASTVSTDRSFGDMSWWDAVVEDGTFVGDVVFDDDLQIFTRDAVIRIDDNQGNFLGVLKTKMNLQHILLTLNDLKQTKKFQNSEISLVSDNGKIVFSTTPSESGMFIPAVDGIAMLVDDTGYFIRTGILGTDSVLHAYSKSAPDDDFPSLDWTLVVKQDGAAILGPVIGLTNTILIISITTIISAIVVANYVRTSISQPLIKLKNASSQIAAGDFNVQLNIQTDDEVGELANKFELMRDNVHFTNENLRELIKMRTTDLKSAMDNLKNNELWTDELTLLHTATLGHGGNLLIAEGQVDSAYSRIVVSIENPDGLVDEYKLILNDRNKYSLPLIRESWMVGDYTVTVTDEATEFASETFTILEAEKTKSALELAFESSKVDAPVTFNNVVTEVIQLDSDYFEQIDEFSGESEFGTITVTRPNTKIAQSTLDISGTVYSTSLEALSGLVEITFTRPSGDIEELTTILTKDGKFSTILVESWMSGDYTLHASYNGNTISELTFFIGDKSSDVDTSSTTQCQDVNCVSVDSEDAILSSPIMITIAGDFENIDSGVSLDVKLIRPDNTSVDLSAILSSSGEFDSPLIHSEEWMAGVYTVIVSYHGDQLSAASFRK